MAMNLIDTGYQFGGKNPQAGLDCSGMVSWLYGQAAEYRLRGSARDMAKRGKEITPAAIRPGDLVFFNTMRLTFSHVGIYVGDNKFIHSPSKGTNVRVDDLGSLYWDKRFDGARRLDGSDNLDDAERQELLNEVKNLKRKSRSL